MDNDNSQNAQDSNTIPACDRKTQSILRALSEPNTASTLVKITGIPRPTIYRRLEKLRASGLVSAEGELFRMSAAGRILLNGVAPLPGGQRLEALWPWLKLLPTPLHRAFVTLALCTLIARNSNCVEDAHPGLILLGGTQRLKSWLCKILCLLAGATPERCRVPMQQIRQRGLLVRLDSTGEIAYRSEQLKEPFLWLEELSLAEPGVMRDVTALMQGSKTLRVENQRVEVEAVPLIEMNPLKANAPLEERVGLRPERIRRNLIADFSTVDVTRAMRASAGEILERFKALGALTLPQAKTKTVSTQSLARIDDVLSYCVRREMIDYVDGSRIQTLILGAMALLPEQDAAVEVLWAWCELAESSGFLTADWRATLASLLQEPKTPDAAGNALIPAQPKPENVQIAETITTGGATMINRYKLDDVLLEHKSLLNAAGLRVPEDTARIAGFLAVAAEMARAGDLPIDSFLKYANSWSQLVAFSEDVKTLGLNQSILHQMSGVLGTLAACGLSLDELELFIQRHQKLVELNLSEAAAISLVEMMNRVMKTIPDQEQAFRQLLHMAEHQVELYHEIQALKAEHSNLEQQIAEQKLLAQEYEDVATRYEALADSEEQRYRDAKKLTEQLMGLVEKLRS